MYSQCSTSVNKLWLHSLFSQLTVILCVAAAILLFLAPEQPYLIVYNAGSYAIYPALVLAITAVVAVVLTLIGCSAVVCDSKCLLATVRYMYILLHLYCLPQSPSSPRLLHPHPHHLPPIISILACIIEEFGIRAGNEPKFTLILQIMHAHV